MHSLLKPVLAGILAACMAHCVEGCTPVGGLPIEEAYKKELIECVNKATTLTESCECRKAVDERYGLCDHPDWPNIGRCDYECR